MVSLAFVFPLRPGKTEEWRVWGEEIWGARRSEYEAFRRKHGLTAHRRYLQHTPRGDQAITYLEGEDLQRTFQHLRTSQDPFAIWLRQRATDLLDGLDGMQTEPASLSTLVFDGPSAEQDEASSQAWEAMERLGLISP
jgi:hypothetical protein